MAYVIRHWLTVQDPHSLIWLTPSIKNFFSMIIKFKSDRIPSSSETLHKHRKIFLCQRGGRNGYGVIHDEVIWINGDMNSILDSLIFLSFP